MAYTGVSQFIVLNALTIRAPGIPDDSVGERLRPRELPIVTRLRHADRLPGLRRDLPSAGPTVAVEPFRQGERLG